MTTTEHPYINAEIISALANGGGPMTRAELAEVLPDVKELGAKLSALYSTRRIESTRSTTTHPQTWRFWLKNDDAPGARASNS